ncbi:MAG: hypothetical protein JST84_14345 [Acidobacteria bacterium]|nr:hypothetical protein [Acidobacteriota bacterium]
MGEEMILQAMELMHEQTDAYRRLDSVTTQLTTALAQSNPESVASIVRAGESELLDMRARLLRLMFKLTAFADMRASTPNQAAITAGTREAFSKASSALQEAAGKYQRSYGRAAALAINGTIFASVSIELFGIQPTTYRAPYTRRGEGKAWV